jgi:4-hydroxybenzoate polyprenyltransferase
MKDPMPPHTPQETGLMSLNFKTRTVGLLFQSLRPHQWIKNGFIFLPLIFAQKALSYPHLVLTLQAVAVFCLMTGAVYLVNDLLDMEADRRHPRKKNRPLAAGLISPRLASGTAAALILVSLAWGLWVHKGLFLVLVVYLTIQFFYNYRLKEVVILDVFCVSAGFFLRVIAGSVTIQVPMSRWLIICTILVAMFLSLCKRRHELLTLGQAEAGTHRKVLQDYSPYLLDQMIGLTTGGVLLSYLLYCTAPETVSKIKSDHLIYTFPFVLYGIFRYLYLIHQRHEGGSPERILVSDLPMLGSVVLWGASCLLILHGVL